jgi:hypothetical protein
MNLNWCNVSGEFWTVERGELSRIVLITERKLRSNSKNFLISIITRSSSTPNKFQA